MGKEVILPEIAPDGTLSPDAGLGHLSAHLSQFCRASKP